MSCLAFFHLIHCSTFNPPAPSLSGNQGKQTFPKISGIATQDFFGLFSLGAVLSFLFAGGIEGCPRDTLGQLNPVSSAPVPLHPMSDTAEHQSKLADRGEAGDINYANLKATQHRKLICKVSVPVKWGKLFIWLQKKLLSDKE